MSLFVADLAFDDARPREEATAGVLAASVVAASLGTVLLRLAARRRPRLAARPTRLDPPVDPEIDHVRGPAGAPLTLVEYAGPECPFCGRATGVVEELRARFGDELRYVFRHLPLPETHPHRELAAALLRTDPRGAPTDPPPVAPRAARAPSAAVTLSPPAVLPAVASVAETPDATGAFPRLTDAQLAPLRRAGRRRTTFPGQLLLRGGGPDYDFIVVLEGTVAVLEQEPGDEATPR